VLNRCARSALTQLTNPSGGLEGFAWEWALKIRIDDPKVETKNFEALC